MKKQFNEHPTVTVDYQGKPILIDKNILSIIQLLWRHGFSTKACCQGDPTDESNLGYIKFDKQSYQKLSNLINPEIAKQHCADVVIDTVRGSVITKPRKKSQHDHLIDNLMAGAVFFAKDFDAFYFRGKYIENVNQFFTAKLNELQYL